MLNEKGSDARLAFGDFVIDRADERVIGPHGPVRLGQKAYRVLLALAEQDGKLLTKDALFSSVWDGTFVSESALTSAVKELRRALGDESRMPTYIESVYGRGYRLIAPVRPADEPPPFPRSAPAPARAPAPAVADDGEPPLVLVSAFRDEAVRHHHPYCAAELREEILSGLARFREIQLIADDRPEEEAAQDRRGERGYQLTAALLPEGEGVKVIARAKRLGDRRVVWAETLSLADTGTAGGVEKIVRRIVGSALPAVDEDLLAVLPNETDDLYGRYLIAKRRSLTATNFDEAKSSAEELERIIGESPGFALAYPPLVRLYNTDFGYTALGSSGAAERANALRLAKEGLAADRANAHAHTVLGFCYLWQGELDHARPCFDRALALNPYNPVRLQECATAWMFMGDLASARSLMERSAELNPLADDGYLEDMGRLQLLEGEFGRARATLEGIVSGTIWADLYLSICELQLGDESGRQRFLGWRRHVEQNWHSSEAPDDEGLAAWIRFHNPLPDRTSEHFYAGVNAALRRKKAAATPAPRPAS